MALKKQLTTTYDLDAEIVAVKKTNFSFDISNSLVHIGYSTLQAGNVPFQEDIPTTLSGTDYTDFIARINTLGATLSASDAISQAALEYCPGTGTISGDIKTLTTPYTIDSTVMGQDIDSYAADYDEQIIHIGYSVLSDINTAVQSDLVYTLTGQEFDNLITRLNELEGTYSVTNSMIAALLEAIPGDGTIVNV